MLKQLDLDRYVGPAGNLARDSFSYLDGLPGVLVALGTFAFRGGLTSSSNGPLWSLALEMQAYVFAGLAAQIVVARSHFIRIASAAGLVLALRARGLHGLETYHFMCFGIFAAGIALSFLPLRFPEVIPVVRLDFSYSLYILHFPVMLFIFFMTCQGDPPPSTAYAFGLIAVSLCISVGLSIVSGLLFERRAWMHRLRHAPSGAA